MIGPMHSAMGHPPEVPTASVPAGVSRFAQWLLHVQTSHPRWLVALVGITIALALWLSTRLELRTEFSAMLPDSYPSVREYRRVTQRLPASSKLLVVLEGHDNDELRRFGDRVVARLKSAQLPRVVSAEDGVKAARDFLLPRALLFLDLPELQRLVARADELWNQNVAKAAGFDLELEDESAAVAVPTDFENSQVLDSLKAQVDRYPGGYYQSRDGQALIVVVHTSVKAGEISGAEQVLHQVRDLVSTEVRTVHPNHVRLGYAGDLVTGLLEYSAVRNDLLQVGMLGLALILLAIFLYYRHASALVALGITIATGCAWTFAITQLLIGQLNVVTGFLFSIIAGNGINFGIIVLARYFEELRRGQPVVPAIKLACATTWKATLTAALAAAAAYGSLYVSDFRGLKHFALIGAIGMLLCWVATFVVLPSVVVLLNRTWSTRRGRADSLPPSSRGLRYEAPFAWLLQKSPWGVAAGCSIVALFSVIAISRGFGRDPMQYNMKQLFNQMADAKGQKRLSTLAREAIGVANESSMAILCDRRDQVSLLTDALHQRWLQASGSAKPFEALHGIDDFVPQDQVAKLRLANKLRDRLTRAHARALIAEAQWQTWAPYLPNDDVTTFTMAELPEVIARPFTERDGQRGRIVYVEPTHGADEDDVHYLMRWADSFRETPLPTGEVVYGSGRIVIFADMLKVVLHDMPIASYLSFLMTAAVVLATSRYRRDAGLILVGLMTGVLWLAGAFFALQLKLNFLNFIALPITFGIGVDYAVNVVQRYRQNPEAGPLAALHASGGAVTLCSLTTSLGYIALLGSKNQAVHSLGLLAVLGEMTCLIAAMLVIPSVLTFLRGGSPTNLRGTFIKSMGSVKPDLPELRSVPFD